ncbi:hypothetical protein N7E81_11965 [Reichenbachiella carrageenanivorans]|uniref:Uncharacterized protein n=1 Tax=Reichenbachiella carrageenanivorans TaxID=2979869 RepID=A0ABY6CZ26_9BACT|nr:hypothetical protein [Reichenbachiella carrageenanivorans]UXX78073.1 hypothetical protein N7E81_11965 [Reichenbachiella carrageenanivorans]
MNRATYITVLLILGLQTLALGQKKKKDAVQDTTEQESFIVQPKRIEFEIGNKDEDFIVISAQEKGLLVVKQTTNRTETGFVWEMYLVDSALSVVWNRALSINYGSVFLGYDYSDHGFFLLFGKSQYKLDDMTVYQMGLAGEEILSYKVNLALPLELSHFEVVANSLIFGGYSNMRPVITVIDLDDPKPKVMPGIYNNNSSIIDVRTDKKTNNFTVVMSEQTQSKQVTVSLKTFTEKGEIVHTETLDTEYEKSLVDGVSTSFDNGTQYVAGTYSKRKSEYSRGLYLAKLNLGKQEFINYYDYAELGNFFSYMRAKREKRVKEKIERKKVKGQKAKFNYRLLINDIIQKDDEYVLIGEAYYPKYSSYGNNNFYNQNGFGASNGFANPNFIGYKYTHAVVVGFSKKGELLWDNSFEINDLLSYSLKENVQISVEDERIVLLYVYENVIRSKIIQNDEILEGKSFDPIELHFKSDEIRENDKEMEGLEKWYEGNFYAYGIQHIKNLKDKDVKLNRRVFYINKVQYQ